MSAPTSTLTPVERLTAAELDADSARRVAFGLDRAAPTEEIRAAVTRQARACWDLAELFLDREGCDEDAARYIERAEQLEAVTRRLQIGTSERPTTTPAKAGVVVTQQI